MFGNGKWFKASEMLPGIKPDDIDGSIDIECLDSVVVLVQGEWVNGLAYFSYNLGKWIYCSESLLFEDDAIHSWCYIDWPK